ncbi:DUF6041 domain-containing protein [Spartinivicinus poritis]|uniref:DUF6041 domain-containing protein n=1 Tax=Spartinivicinus poritis TaxID=2994640 RepID=A0ABT5U575_9GAMM|nr:DUF6041 domain-containing protein [Spartinivicinus sp. A2-2]MDE1461508.1 DUF6041 domain-containing protein [Spartinivicinus sp. A2-2]
MTIIQKIIGIIYMLAGIAKAFPQVEDVKEVLINALEANHETILEPLTSWLVSHSTFITIFVGLALFFSGLILYLNKFLIKTTISAQIIMLICFISILHRAYWQIFIIDGFFIIISALIVKFHLQPTDNSSISSPNIQPIKR